MCDNYSLITSRVQAAGSVESLIAAMKTEILQAMRDEIAKAKQEIIDGASCVFGYSGTILPCQLYSLHVVNSTTSQVSHFGPVILRSASTSADA